MEEGTRINETREQQIQSTKGMVSEVTKILEGPLPRALLVLVLNEDGEGVRLSVGHTKDVLSLCAEAAELGQGIMLDMLGGSLQRLMDLADTDTSVAN